jgi:hypothetical protein
METLAFPLLVTMQRKNTGVVSLSMELLRLRLPSNDGLQSNTSQYYPTVFATLSSLSPLLHLLQVKLFHEILSRIPDFFQIPNQMSSEVEFLLFMVMSLGVSVCLKRV